MLKKFCARLCPVLKRRILWVLSITLFSMLISCNTPIEDSLPENKKENPNNFTEQPIVAVETKKDSIDAALQKVKPVAMTGHSVSESDIDGLDDQLAPKGSSVSEAPFYTYFAERQKDFKDENHVTISFNVAPIEEVVPTFAKILDFNFYLDPTVKGVVTMSVDSNLSKEDVWQIFEQILVFSGAYCSVQDGVVHILPLSAMTQERIVGGAERYQSNVSVVLFRLKNIKSTNLAQQIKPFLSNGAVIIDVADQNSLMIVELPSNMPKIRSIINMLDVSNKHSWPRAVVKCSNIAPSAIAAELAKVLPVLGFPVEYNPPDNSTGSGYSSPPPSKSGLADTDNIGAINLQAIDRLQLLVVSAANDEVLNEVKKWVDVLDRSDVGDQDQIFIYNIMNASADDLVQTMSIIFNVQGATLNAAKSTQSSAAGGSSSGTGSSSSGKSSGSGGFSMSATAYEVTQVTSQNTQQGNQSGGGQQGTNNQNSASIYNSPMKVMADAKNQRLVIRCTPRAYAVVKALLDRIDTMPAQALLSVTVADISFENDLDIGLQGKFKADNSPLGNTEGTDYGLSPAGTGASWVLNSKNADATFHALSIDKKVTTLAKPEILVQSHSQGKISIGQSVSIQTGQTNSGSSGGTTSSYDYKDVGIIIIMTPHITKGGLINLEFSQTSSKIDKSNQSDSTAGNPTITQEVLNTVMNVPDGGTIVIGGLVKDDVSDSLETVPFISNIPLLNRMVGSTSLKKSRAEMLVMVTAKIITKTSDLEQMTERYQHSVKLIKDGFSKDAKDNSEVFKAEDTNKIYIKGD